MKSVQTGTCGDCKAPLFEGPEQRYCDDCDTARVDLAFDVARAAFVRDQIVTPLDEEWKFSKY